jgi:hypothetical protein
MNLHFLFFIIFIFRVSVIFLVPPLQITRTEFYDKIWHLRKYVPYTKFGEFITNGDTNIFPVNYKTTFRTSSLPPSSELIYGMSLSHWYTQVICSTIFSYPFFYFYVAKCIIVTLESILEASAHAQLAALTVSLSLPIVLTQSCCFLLLQSVHCSFMSFQFYAFSTYATTFRKASPTHACTCYLIRSLLIREKGGWNQT